MTTKPRCPSPCTDKGVYVSFYALSLWQQYDLYGVANHVQCSSRAAARMWMYETKVTAR